MLIDRTYFIGEINIPNTSNQAVAALLDHFIERYEPEFLKKALGYELYTSFMAGVAVSPPVQDKWLRLLQGGEYTTLAQELFYWKGLVSQPLSTINAIDAANSTIIVVGRGQQYDPADGSASTIIPAALVGKDFTLTQRLVGQLRPDEYTVAGNSLTLTDTVFNQGDTFFFKSASLALSQSSGIYKKSPIANYVYYWFMRNNATQTAATGEVKGTSENSANVSASVKIVRAWNEMAETVREMNEFLMTFRDLYNWDHNRYHYRRHFRPINEFNI
jgi:hypothetical protein